MKRLLIIVALFIAPALIAQESFVQLPPDSTGKKLRARSNVVGANTVYSQGFFIDDGSGGANPLGIASNPLFVTFTNATIGATQSGTWTVNDQHSNVTADYDTGAGTQTMTMFGIALPKSGGAVAGGTSTDPVRTDPTGVTTQPVSAASLPLPTGAATETTLAGIKTGTDKIPSSPATDRTTAAAPFSNRLSDGAAFYDATKTGQLPAALDGSGNLKTHEQGTATVAGSVTANAGTNLNTSALALDATLTNRLPAGSTPANGESNSVTTSRLGVFTFFYNGTTWDRWNGAVTQSGTWNVNATQSGTWTVQPGNTANSTAWLVTGTGGTFPVTQATGTNLHAVLDTTSTTAVTQATASNLNATVVQGTAAASTAGWPTTGGTVATSTASWTSATSVGSTISVATTGYGTAFLTFSGTATITGGIVVFELSDDGGTSWFPVDGYRRDPMAVLNNSGTFSTTATAWSFDVAGATNMRARLSVAIVGTGTLTFRLQASNATRGDGLSIVGNTPAVNVTSVGSNGILTGNGVTGTGSQRVTIASDNTPFPVKTDQTTHGTTDLVAADVTKVGGNTINAAVPVIIVQAPPVLSGSQLSNPLLYRAAMQQYCSTNLCSASGLGR